MRWSVAMSVDTANLLFAKQARDLFPMAGGHRPSQDTITRWMRDGVRGVKLGSFRVGARRATTHEAIRIFVESLQDTGRPQERDSATTGARACDITPRLIGARRRKNEKNDSDHLQR